MSTAVDSMRNRALCLGAALCLSVAVPSCSREAGANREARAEPSASAERDVESRQPNVILIAVDTVRADHLSIYGYERETTPELERLFADGTIFDRAYSPASWTLPAMAMMLTGLVRSDNSGDIVPREVTLAERFHEQGYATWGVSAHPLLQENKGWYRGFDDFAVYGAREVLVEGEWHAERLTNRAFKLLVDHTKGETPEQPFFLFLFYFDPHDPYLPTAEPEFSARLDPERKAAFHAALPEHQRELLTDEVYAEIESQIALYDSEIREVDRAVGRLHRKLVELELLDDTIIVFTSDHGEGLWQRARPADEPPKDRGYFPPLFYGHGLTLHDEQLHVPFLWRGPGIPKGQRRDAAVSTLDVTQTLAALVGAPAPDSLDGCDLFGASAESERAELLAFNLRGASIRVDGRYKLHLPRPHLIEREGLKPELFDLESDPLEQHPIQLEAIEQRLRERLDEWIERGVRPESKSRSNIDARLLEELGYTDSQTGVFDDPAEPAEGADG